MREIPPDSTLSKDYCMLHQMLELEYAAEKEQNPYRRESLLRSALLYASSLVGDRGSADFRRIREKLLATLKEGAE